MSFRHLTITACLLFSVVALAQTATKPKVTYSTFFNGNAQTYVTSSTADANGYQYLTGYTQASVFPTTSGAYRRTPTADSGSSTGYQTMFVAKLKRDGSGLVYSTFIANAIPSEIVVDKAGNAYVVGGLNSAAGFPITSAAWQKSCVLPNQFSCSFLLKLNAAGSAVVFSTFLNAKQCQENTGQTFEHIAVDQAGEPHVVGTAGADCFTTSNAFKETFSSQGVNPLVMKLKSDGSGVIYSTYVGGSGSDTDPASTNDWPTAITVDSNGRAIIVGDAHSLNFPTTNSAFQRTMHGGELGDAFVAKLSTDGSALLASTLIGGSDSDIAYDVTTDQFNQVYVSGTTTSKDFPVTSSAFQKTVDPGICDYQEGGEEFPCFDAFVVKLPMDFSKPTYSTYLGGPDGDEYSPKIAVDEVGHAFVAGTSNSSSFPLVKPTGDNTLSMFLSELNTAGSGLLFSTRYGAFRCCNGGETDAHGLGIDVASDPYVAGNSDYVKTTSGAFQTGGVDNVLSQGFAAQWDVPPCTLSSADRTVTICSPSSTSVPKKLLLSAGATDSKNVSAMKVYVDGTSVYSITASHFNTFVNLSAGTHRITVKAWDSVGAFAQSISVTAP